MDARYFAYGSNLSVDRMRGRVASARALGRARLHGMRFVLDKRGADGTGKANLTAARDASVWGVVYALDPRHWPDLDACEPGYDRIAVSVEVDWSESAGRLRALTYVSRLRMPDPAADPGYRRLIVEGAREHGLPEAHVAMLERLPVR